MCHNPSISWYAIFTVKKAFIYLRVVLTSETEQCVAYKTHCDAIGWILSFISHVALC